MVTSLLSSLIKAGNKPPPATPGKPKKATTFQEFESITSDAWDVGDDDDELLAMAAQNLNIEVVMETANKVNDQMQEHHNQEQLLKITVSQTNVSKGHFGRIEIEVRCL